jgi:small-conductance mechanosensitive channel
MLIVPAPHEVPAFFARAAPFTEAGGILLGAYVVSRVIHPLTGRLAVKMGLDAQNLPTFRLGTNVAVWIAAASAALVVGGASHTTLTAVFGAGGTILSFALGDILGNVIQGLNFLITRPFTVGARVQIGDETGTVTDVTLTNIVLKMDDGSPGRMRHAALADVPVIVSGTYVAAADAKFRLSVPAKPKFHGAFGAIVKSLDRRFWFAAAAFAALLAFPALVPFAAAGWAATAVHWSLAGVIVWLTRRLDMTLRAAVDQLSRANGWRTETTVITHLAVSALLWAFGGGAALRLFGLSWMTLIASLGLTTFVVGLASKKFFGSVFKVLFAKPVKIGDRVRLKTISGLVVGMTLSHVVLRLDDERYELVPYAVVDAALVNNPLAVTSGK